MKLRRKAVSDKKAFRRMNDRIEDLVNNPLIMEDVRRYAAEREHTVGTVTFSKTRRSKRWGRFCVLLLLQYYPGSIMV
jgi:hypothetical protein